MADRKQTSDSYDGCFRGDGCLLIDDVTSNLKLQTAWRNRPDRTLGVRRQALTLTSGPCPVKGVLEIFIRQGGRDQLSQ
ncbi:hypothetical protein CEXT_9871 [Caerostris extrusa]|uniref:Uncharacterized protein n=1 Tax=Caerostris extrusa TaxID=172846 RepID=A0AAV4VBN3_CAEEX|nr:hypothetical protein CEXT_9871 [Caerostris extrusa]